jgi:1,4-alpha-glucan branching enzyme
MSEGDRVGDLAVVLHTHMPYVEGFGTYPFGEEWLFDAVLRSYVSIGDVVDRLTMSVTPVLADQLEAAGVHERMVEFCRRFRIESCEADAEDVDAPLRDACRAEAERYRAALARLDSVRGDPLRLFSEAHADGRVELLASSATHAVLPMVATRAGRNLQLDAGLRSHRRRFGEPRGIWLPECAYEPGLERLVAEHGLAYFCTDQSAHEDPLAALAPVAAGAGTLAFTIDWEAVGWLWSLDGYPSDPAFADFHRKTLRGARPWRIDGEPYDPEAADARARELGREFVAAVAERLARDAADRGRPGLCVFAIDTELIGHWWWEGPAWLAEVLGAAGEAGVELVTLGQAAARHEPEQRELRRSTWGEGKDLSTWDSPAVADMAWAARRLELRVLRGAAGDPPEAALTRATRELLAVQASDWAFLDRRGQAGDYPWQRSTGHARALLEAINATAHPPDPGLRNLAPDLDLTPLREP